MTSLHPPPTDLTPQQALQQSITEGDAKLKELRANGAPAAQLAPAAQHVAGLRAQLAELNGVAVKPKQKKEKFTLKTPKVRRCHRQSSVKH